MSVTMLLIMQNLGGKIKGESMVAKSVTHWREFMKGGYVRPPWQQDAQALGLFGKPPAS